MPQHEQVTCAELPRSEQIARLNDQLRMGQGKGKIVVTKAVHGLTGFDTDVLMAALANYECGSAWKRDPGSGVIGVEKGPLIPVV
ncbi:hypothetical protein ACOYW6_09560 [Parablastomonas sp. CN1-191]|uniref:hypothetical protein n=1 Tax=Parablastomonas sp. CN1-191 TaxID=3400908 RepID=UPI003BF8719D